MKRDTKPLCKQLGYQFNNERLLEAALSHRSSQGSNNERLEFLGDSIVNFIIAEALYERYPEAKEGKLSRLRANLVRRETLAAIAGEFSLGQYLRLGSGELKSGGFRRESILADALEAVIAAIYLDSSIETIKGCILRWFTERLAALSFTEHYKDAKSMLQEYLQSHKHSLPIYEIVEIAGEAHSQIFHVQCSVKDLDCVATAQGSNRRKAEQAAAEAVLKMLEL